jgi:CheY-like chemotaxis protein
MSSGKKIMVVDDEPDIVYVVRSILEKAGYEVVGANSGEEALDRLMEENPDLVLLDVMMPGIDGWETCRRIKEKSKHILVAMLTVMAGVADKEKSFRFSGADAHITKPIIEEKVLGTVAWLLKCKPSKSAD